MKAISNWFKTASVNMVIVTDNVIPRMKSWLGWPCKFFIKSWMLIAVPCMHIQSYACIKYSIFLCQDTTPFQEVKSWSCLVLQLNVDYLPCVRTRIAFFVVNCIFQTGFSWCMGINRFPTNDWSICTLAVNLIKCALAISSGSKNEFQ